MPDLQRGRQLFSSLFQAGSYYVGANRLFSHIQRPSHLRETLQGNDWYLIQSNDKTQREALLKKLTFDEREKIFPGNCSNLFRVWIDCSRPSFHLQWQSSL